MTALRRSMALVRGGFWGLVGRMLGFAVVVYLVPLVAWLTVSMRFGLIATGLQEAPTLWQTLSLLVLNVVLAPAGYLFATLLYYRRRAHTEGTAGGGLQPTGAGA